MSRGGTWPQCALEFDGLGLKIRAECTKCGSLDCGSLSTGPPGPAPHPSTLVPQQEEVSAGTVGRGSHHLWDRQVVSWPWCRKGIRELFPLEASTAEWNSGAQGGFCLPRVGWVGELPWNLGCGPGGCMHGLMCDLGP